MVLAHADAGGRGRRIRVGLIGYGFSGKTFHAPLIASVTGLHLAAVSSRDAARVQADFPDMVVHADPQSLITADDIDVVVIATPNDTHAQLARDAIRAGKHVVIDKPFTLDIDEARSLLQLAQRQGTLLSVFHNRRWDSDFLTVRAAIEAGDIGTVRHFESHMDRFRPEVRDRWRERGGAGSGVWYDLGPHMIDQALILFGLPDRVQASLAMQRAGALTDDWAHVVLCYGETRVILQASMLAAGGSDRFTVHGDTGSLTKQFGDRQERQLLDGMRPGDAHWGEDPDALMLHDGSQRRERPAVPGDQRDYYRGIAAALNGTGNNPVAPIEALAVMAVLNAAIDSAKTGVATIPAITDDERNAVNAALRRQS